MNIRKQFLVDTNAFKKQSSKDDKDPISNAIEMVKRSSKKERRVDALALRADERRDKLRKAAGRSKYP